MSDLSRIGPRLAADFLPPVSPETDVQTISAAAAAVPVSGAARAAAPSRETQAASGPAYGSAAWNRLLDARTGSTERPQNRVDLLFDGVASFAERKRLIESAKESICLQTFIFTDDETGWNTARLLASAAERGVKVRVIFDGLGSNRSDEKIFDFMRKAGCEVREYADPTEHLEDLNDRWHEKHLIVDGRVSIEGGMNIADEYAFGGSARLALRRPVGARRAWRDADARLEGPAVGDAQAAFLRNWKELGSPVPRAEALRLVQKAREGAVEGGAGVRVVQHRPEEDGDRNTQELFLAAIGSARSSIVIENAYFNPPDDIREALIDAARRGVEVRVMTNSRKTNDTTVVSDAARYFYDEMVAAGIQIYERQKSTLHSKTAAFDGQFSIVGSANLNGRSDGLDSEAVLAVDDKATAASLAKRFESGLPEAKLVTKRALEREPLLENVKQWSLSLLSWVF